jgi:hypothetical protein
VVFARRCGMGAGSWAFDVNRSDETGNVQPKLAQLAGNFRERFPASALRRHDDRIWTSEFSGAATLDVVPDGCIDIY